MPSDVRARTEIQRLALGEVFAGLMSALREGYQRQGWPTVMMAEAFNLASGIYVNFLTGKPTTAYKLSLSLAVPRTTVQRQLDKMVASGAAVRRGNEYQPSVSLLASPIIDLDQATAMIMRGAWTVGYKGESLPVQTAVAVPRARDRLAIAETFAGIVRLTKESYVRRGWPHTCAADTIYIQSALYLAHRRERPLSLQKLSEITGAPRATILRRLAPAMASGMVYKKQGTYQIAERFISAPMLDLDKACAIIRRAAAIIQSDRDETLSAGQEDGLQEAG